MSGIGNQGRAAMGRQRRARGWTVARAILTVVLTLVLGVTATAAHQVAGDFSPASGHAQVIAQGVVDPPTDELVWRTARGRAPLPANAPFEARPIGFVLATSAPIVLVDQASGELTRLGPGEATFVRGGTVQQRASLADEPASYLAIDLLPANELSGGGEATVLATSAPFRLAPGPHDLDLVRDVLTGSETLTLPETGETNVVLVTEGSLTVSRPDGNGGTLIAGEAATFSGELTMAVAGGGAAAEPAPDDRATVAVAVIGAGLPPELVPAEIPEQEQAPPATAGIPGQAPTATEATPPPPDEGAGAGTGSITVQVANCPPGMRPDTLAVAVCATTETDFDVTLSGEPLETTLTLADATTEGAAFTWSDLPFGEYLLAEAVLPVGYDEYVVTGPTATGSAETGYVVTLDEANPELVLRIYNFGGE